MNVTITINETGNVLLGTIVRATNSDSGEPVGAWANGPSQDGALHAARQFILARPELQVYQVIYQIQGREVVPA